MGPEDVTTWTSETTQIVRVEVRHRFVESGSSDQWPSDLLCSRGCILLHVLLRVFFLHGRLVALCLCPNFFR